MTLIEDELLKWKFKRGDAVALSCIYEKYLDRLLSTAMGLLNDPAAAEDVVHDVFISFAKWQPRFRLRGSLKGYLTTCVLNRARDNIRANKRRSAAFGKLRVDDVAEQPEQRIEQSEEARMLNDAVALLPPDLREVVVLRLTSELRFRQIAEIQGVSVNTARGRYRYALSRLRTLLNGEMEK
jgi:RNA polymerase sigma-70 factor (ECF subfamily)